MIPIRVRDFRHRCGIDVTAGCVAVATGVVLRQPDGHCDDVQLSLGITDADV